MKRPLGLKPCIIRAGALIAAFALVTPLALAQEAGGFLPLPRPERLPINAPAIEQPPINPDGPALLAPETPPATPPAADPAAGAALTVEGAAGAALGAAGVGAPLAAEGVPAPPPSLGAEPLNFLPNAARTEPLDLLPIPTPLEPAPSPAAGQEFVLTALLAEGGQPIPDGLNWRIFGPQPGADGQLPLVAEATGGIARVTLPPGEYLLHAAYGRAGATARIEVGPDNNEETIVLNAGGLRLGALVGDDVPIPPDDLRFEVYVDTEAEIGRAHV